MSLSHLLSFSPPTFSGLKSSNQPVTGSSSLTLHGGGIGHEEATAKLRQGASSTEGSGWTSDSSALCKSSMGTGRSVSIKVTFGLEIGTVSAIMSFLIPALSKITFTNSPKVGLRSRLFLGSTFGTSSNTVVGTVGNSACQISVWRSDSSLRCKITPGLISSRLAFLTASSVALSSLTFCFSFDLQNIVSMQPRHNFPVTGGIWATVVGQNFAIFDFSLELRLAATSADASIWKSDSSLICKVAAGSDYATNLNIDRLALSLTVANQLVTSGAVYVYDMPTTSTVSPNNVPTAIGNGHLLMNKTLYQVGHGYGAWDFTLATRFGNSAAEKTVWDSCSTLYVQSPYGQGSRTEAKTVVITLGLKVSSVSQLLTYDAPAISSIRISNGPAGGSGILTLVGNNFGSVDGTLSASVGIFKCVATSWQSDTSLICQSAGAYGKGLYVDIPSLSPINFVLMPACDSLLCYREGMLTVAFSYDAPIISNVNPVVATPLQNFQGRGSSKLETIMRVEGTNFGGKDSSPVVQIGQTIGSALRWLGNDVIIAGVPAGVGEKLSVFVTVAQQYFEIPLTFSYFPPIIIGSARNSSYDGSLTVFGQNFGADDYSLSGRIGPTACEQSLYYSDTALFCKVSSGVGGLLSIAVTVGLQYQTGYEAYGFVPPIMLGMLATNQLIFNSPALPGNTISRVTVSGIHFGTSDFTPRASVAAPYYPNYTTNSDLLYIMYTACESTSWVSETSIFLRLPSGFSNSGIQLVLIATVAGQQPWIFGNKLCILSYDCASILVSLQPNSAALDTRLMAISGSNMGYADLTVRTRFTGTSAQQTTWISDSSVLNRPASGQVHKGTEGIAITIWSLISQTRTAFISFDLPLIYLVESLSSALVNAADEMNMLQVAELSDVTNIVQQFDGISLSALTSYANQATSRGSLVTVALLQPSFFRFVGQNLGFSDFTAVVSGSRTSFEATSWVQDFSVICKGTTGSAQGSDLVRITVQIFIGSITEALSYNLPSLSQMSRQNSPNKNISALLSGSDFGTTCESPAVLVGWTLSTSTHWLTDTCVSVKIEPGTLRTLGLAVTSGTKCGSVSDVLSFDKPSIVNVSNPVNSPVTGSISLFVFGIGFGYGQDVSSRMRIDRSTCELSQWIADTSIRGKLAGGTYVGDIFQGGVPENVIIIPSPEFSSFRTTPKGIVYVTVASQVQTVSDVISYDSPSLGLTRFFSINESIPFWVIDPPRAGVLGALFHTVGGGSFGRYDVCPKLRLGETSSETTVWVSYTTVTMKTAGGTSFGLDIVFTVALQDESSTLAFTYDFPSMLWVDPVVGPTDPGSEVQIFGRDLGNAALTYQIRVGFTAPQVTALVSATSLTAGLATGLGGIYALVLTAGNSAPESTWVGVYDYHSPNISQLLPANGPVTGGYPIYAYGFNFGYYDSTVYSMVSDQPCESTRWQSDTAFICKVPYIAADANALVDISVQGQNFVTTTETASEIAVAPNLFQYDAPRATDLTR